MINLTDLSFSYPGSTSPVLKGVNLQIPPGTLTLVTGASGSGKSTLLRCLNGLVPHFTGGQISGSITVGELNPIASGPEAMANRVGFVFQEPEAQFVFDIVEDEIAFSLENAGLARDEIETRINSVCSYLHLESIRAKSIHQISGGEKQRVAVASALVNQPQVLVLDEPTSQLDPRSANELLRYVVSLKESLGLTVIIAEHRLERLLPFTDLMIHLKADGQCLSGPPEEILENIDQVPPIITLAKRMHIKPLPLTINAFPKITLPETPAPRLEIKTRTPQASDGGLEVQDFSVTLEKSLIIDRISFKLNPGEILALLGPNGVGKTTLLRAMFGLIPFKGNLFLKGQPIKENALSKMIQAVGYLPQNPNDLLFAETVLDELKVTLQNHGMERSRDELTQFLTYFDLSHHQDDYPRDLSVGERQRTALASITVHDPDFILLDEPTRGLDYENKTRLVHLFQKWRDQNKGILVITHDVEFAALLADRVIILDQGKIKFSGDPHEAFHHFPGYRTQTAQIFPENTWITPEDVPYR